MIDYSKLCQIADGKQSEKKAPKKDVPSKKPKVKGEERKILDSVQKKAAEKRKIKDSLKKQEVKKQIDAFRVTDSYKSFKKKIKDELAETESTDDAVAVAVQALENAPAEQVITAVVDILGEAIDILQGQSSAEDTGDSAEPAQVAEPDADEDSKEEEVKDSVSVDITNDNGETVNVSADGGNTTISANANGGASAPVDDAPMSEPPVDDVPPVDENPIDEAPVDENPMIDEEPTDLPDSAKKQKMPKGKKKVKDGMSEEEIAGLDAAEGDIFAEIEKLISEGKNDEAIKMLHGNAELLNGLGHK